MRSCTLHHNIAQFDFHFIYSQYAARPKVERTPSATLQNTSTTNVSALTHFQLGVLALFTRRNKVTAQRTPARTLHRQIKATRMTNHCDTQANGRMWQKWATRGRIARQCGPYVFNAHLTRAFKTLARTRAHTDTMPPALLSMQKIGQPSFSSDINLWGGKTHRRAI